MTLDQVAEDLQLSRRTVERFIAAQILPSVRVGGSRRVAIAELDGWLEQRSTVGGSSANSAGGRSSVDAPVERDGTSSTSEAVERAQVTGEEAA